MKFFEQELPGVFIIESEPVVDNRGVFRRSFCKEEFAAQGIVNDVIQANISENKYSLTLRGFHYQIPPYGEGKTLTCIQGSCYDIVVDVREKSSTYMQWIALELTSNNRKSVHIPPGCANAFLTLENNSIMHYYCSHSYAPEAERGIRFNDPSFNFLWPQEPKIISNKDLNLPNYDR